ncbi:PQQ-binding-like beta-propeller repeat protein [Streptomyces sp. NPDC006879]|uniref:outer membrane protein assembly factor BamB family protein n=1 Tax=Streptomyces sp. NPDC006879 TaxID=3364767 RepID=UPI00369026FB
MSPLTHPPHQPPEEPGNAPNPHLRPPRLEENPYAQDPPGPAGGFGPPPPGFGPPVSHPPHGQVAPPSRPAGRDGARRGRTLGLVGVVVVAVLAAGGYLLGAGRIETSAPTAAPRTGKDGAAAATGEGKAAGPRPAERALDLDAGRQPGEDRALFLKVNEVDVPASGADTRGIWFAGDTVVKAVYKSLNGYGARDGKPRWSVLFKGAVCAVPPQGTADGRLVVASKDGTSSRARCNQLTMVDLRTGHTGWTKEVPKEGPFDVMASPSMAISGDTVTFSRLGPSSGFRVSDGEKVFAHWKADCLPVAYAGGSKLVALLGCRDGSERIQGTDPGTGRGTWTYRVPGGWSVSRVYAVDPVVIDLSHKQRKQRAVVVLTAGGAVRARVAGADDLQPVCGYGLLHRSLQNCTGVVVDTASLYLPTEPRPDVRGHGRSNAVVAFDLATGKVRWRAEAGQGRRILPVASYGGTLYAYLEATHSQPGQVLALGSDGGTATPVLRHPSGTTQVEDSFVSPQFAYVDGRFFLSTTRLLGTDGVEEKLLMAFGK